MRAVLTVVKLISQDYCVITEELTYTLWPLSAPEACDVVTLQIVMRGVVCKLVATFTQQRFYVTDRSVDVTISGHCVWLVEWRAASLV